MVARRNLGGADPTVQQWLKDRGFYYCPWRLGWGLINKKRKGKTRKGPDAYLGWILPPGTRENGTGKFLVIPFNSYIDQWRLHSEIDYALTTYRHYDTLEDAARDLLTTKGQPLWPVEVQPCLTPKK